ncbi:hypothetical protein [uncultured Roseibium sp.]|uniref:hypothetical protein n=1 Tax=uncultured Roseibium sp. TaxID=1936171 RepID=UPI0026266C37|nr:hypothetical protein [uncultured Roseibium sp.]
MARFPYYQKNVKKLGQLLARAAVDKEFRQAFQSDPSTYLSEIGLPAQTTELLDFKVIDQKEHPNAAALPFRLNAGKLNDGNADYLTNLSASLRLN